MIQNLLVSFICVLGVICLFFISVINSEKPQFRIYGGYFARKNQLPYQVAIYNYNTFGCGGSIYNEKFILTATHCLIDEFLNKIMEPADLKIQVGITELYANATYYSVKNVITHKNYFDDRNDIGLIELTEPLKFSKSVKPIELFKGDFKSGNEVIISGWGQDEKGSLTTRQLKYHKLVASVGQNCSKVIRDNHGGFLCVEHGLGNGMCYGDSGGPAVFNNQLVGIANLVINECGTEKPDVYAYIPFFLDWIKKHTKT